MSSPCDAAQEKELPKVGLGVKFLQLMEKEQYVYC